MKSQKAKVLHEVFFAPMIHHVIRSVLPLKPTRIIVVVGHQKNVVENALAPFDVELAIQENQQGTGHAVLVAEEQMAGDSGPVMILCGDTPLITTATLKQMFDAHLQFGSTLTIMTTVLENPTNYGRILCNDQGGVVGIVEQKDATSEQLHIKEINAGIYCVERAFLFSALKQVGTDNSQNEVYLTDIVKIAVNGGLTVAKFMTDEPADVLGVNSRVELAEAHQQLQRRRNRDLMLQGVTMYSPDTIFVSPDSSIDKDTLLQPAVHIANGSRIDCSCTIGQGTIINNCLVGKGCTIGPYCHLTDCTIEPHSTLAPYSNNCP